MTDIPVKKNRCEIKKENAMPVWCVVKGCVQDARAAGARILDTIFPPRSNELLVRAATSAQLMQISYVRSIQIECLEIHPLLSYGNTLVQALILEAKFHRNQKAYALLGAVLARALESMCAEEAETIPGASDKKNVPVPNVVLVPIPLSKQRLKERGYNQVEETARRAATLLKGVTLPRVPSLIRTRATRPQMELGRKERQQNMIGAFAAPAKQAPLDPSCIYILLDDVVTTGATLLAAYQALKNAGAVRIIVMALAH